MRDFHGQPTPASDTIIEMMQYGQPLVRRESIEQSRTVLQLVEQMLSYYDGSSSGKKSPIITLPRINGEFEKILVEYLTIRVGLFSEKYLREIQSQYRDKVRGVVPEKGTWQDKEAKKEVTFFDKKGRRVSGKSLLSYRVGYNMIARELAETEGGRDYFRDSDEVHTFVYDRTLLPPKRSSLLSKYINEGFTSLARTNVLTGNVDAANLSKSLKYQRIHRETPLRGNVFVIYVNSPRYRSFNSMTVLRSFQKLGYDVNTLFIFDICDKCFSLKNLMDERTRLSNIFNGHSNPEDDYFCYVPEDALKLVPATNYSTNRVTFHCGDDFGVFFPQVADLLEGFGGRRRVLCNILSLCATEASERYFYDHLQTLDQEFEAEGTLPIFEYVRKLWEFSILPEIRSFVGEVPSFSFVVEYSTPEPIKTELLSLFPDKRVVFRKPSELNLGHGRTGVGEERIVVMRFLQCKGYPTSYPNSYDPYILNQGQELIELIPEVLFKDLQQQSLYNQTRHTNTLLDSSFRRKVLAWEPRKCPAAYGQNRFDIFGDDEWAPEDEAPTLTAEKVRLETEDGSVSFPIETEPVIYRTDEKEYMVGSLRDIVDDTEVRGLQFLSDIERQLRELLSDREKKGFSADGGIREELHSSHPQMDFSKGEIWKLALKAKIDSDGMDRVLLELGPQLDEKRLVNRLKDWSNPDSRTMLPRKRKTRKALFEYIGITRYPTYLRSLYSRYLSTIRNSREVNAMIDDLIRATVGHIMDEPYYRVLTRHIPEALELFGIENQGDLETIQTIIYDCITLKPIKSITSNDQ